MRPAENQSTEWKQSWRDEYLRWICGFANAEGGTLVIGRDDKGKAVGVKDARKHLEDIPNKVRDILGIMVDVNMRELAAGEVLEIVVPAYSKHPSQPYNPDIANAFFRAGMIEAWGRGIERILLACRAAGTPRPKVRYDHGGLWVVFPYPAGRKAIPAKTQGGMSGKRLDEKLDEKLGEKLGKTRAAIVKAMRDNPNVTVSGLARLLGLSRTGWTKTFRF